MANSNFAKNGLAGAGFLISGPVAQFDVGQRQEGKFNSEFVYCSCPGAVTGPGYSVIVDQNFNATMVTTALAGNPGLGDKICVSPIAMAAGDFGWFQTTGPMNVQVNAGTAAHTQLNTTTTPGVLGSDATAGSAKVSGLVLIAAQATAGLAPALGSAGFSVTGQN